MNRSANIKHASHIEPEKIYLQRTAAQANSIFVYFIAALFLTLTTFSVEAAQPSGNFDHNPTGFPLDGAHASISCNNCHVEGIFIGTPRDCNSCHTNGSLVNATSKPIKHISVTGLCIDCHSSDNHWGMGIKIDHSSVLGTCASCHNSSITTGKHPGHIQSGNQCDDCHSTTTWLSAKFDHSRIIGNCASCHNGTIASGKNSSHILSTATCDDCHNTFSFSPVTVNIHSSVIGTCASCHNGSVATGKHPAHIQSGSNCDDCHTTNGWIPAVFDHNDPALPANCFTCHNGSTATGKNPTHILSNNTCDDCHANTLSWLPAPNVNHDAVLGSCSSCHNGQTATGKHPAHIQTTAQCDFCHITSNWSAVTFDHASITGDCSSCHNGTTATGKPTSHFITTLECDTCHRNTTWTPDIFVHSSPLYPNGHRQNFQCNDCHLANSESNAWQFTAYQPDCAGCHANDYKTGPHKKYENPDTKYTVNELRDCTGSCHIYTNSSLTTIKERRNTEHRISDGDF